MYDTEFRAALQAIAESVSEEAFDMISEGAAIVIEDEGCAMDEAVAMAAQQLFLEGAVDADACQIVTSVMDEFAKSIPASYEDGLDYLAENYTEEEFDAIMTEAVNHVINETNLLVKGKDAIANTGYVKTVTNAAHDLKTGAQRRAEGKDLIKRGKNLASNVSYRQSKGQVGDSTAAKGSARAANMIDQGSQSVKSGNRYLAQGAKGAAKAAAPIAAAAALYAGGKAVQKHKDEIRAAAEKKLAELKAKKEDKALPAPANESADQPMSLADLRAMF